MGTKNFNSATDLITFTRASSSTFIGSNGLIQTATNNVPRIEYDVDGTVKGLLIEEARTNLVTYSEDFTIGGTHWLLTNGTTATATGNSVLSPDGTTSAYELGMSSGGFVRTLTGHAPSVGETYTASIWLKAGTLSTVGIGILFSGVGLGYVTKNLTLTNEWQRFHITGTVPAGTPDQVRFRVLTLTDTGSIHAFGAQVEQGEFPTSYIPTSGATATRARDIATISTSSFGYNKTEGTVVVEFKSNKPVDESYGAFVLSDGTPANRVGHYTDASSDNTLLFHKGFNNNEGSLNATIASQSVPASSANGFFKYSFAFAENNFTSALNGVLGNTDTSGAFASNLSVLALGHFYPTLPQSNMLNGYIKSVKYYPRGLTNTQLQELTT